MKKALAVIAVLLAACPPSAPVDAGLEDAGACGSCPSGSTCSNGFCVTSTGDGPCRDESAACERNEQCCSRVCAVGQCLALGGCATTGTHCSADQKCCGGGDNPNGSVTCDANRCTPGLSCNATGNPCGAPASDGGKLLPASINCCEGAESVCKLDRAGVPRCFGGQSSACPTGLTGDAGCCIAEGVRCQFADQCCDGAMCVATDGGALTCQRVACRSLGAACGGSGECCAGSTCEVVDGGAQCVSSSCAAAGQACAGGACCDGTRCARATGEDCAGATGCTCHVRL
jgi:hypothetical protein